MLNNSVNHFVASLIRFLFSRYVDKEVDQRLVRQSCWLVALIFLVCGCGRKSPPHVPQRNSERLAEVSARLTQLDKLETDAVRLTVVLDSRLRPGQVSPAKPNGEQPNTAELAVRLKALDSDLNKTLADVYNRASVLPTVDRSAAETQAALTHYRVLLRRASMRGYHTEVPGLNDDPDCRGDLIGDELLGKYFGAVISTSNESRATAISVLSDMGRQSACLGTEQMHSLANDFYSAFSELQSVLRANEREYLIPFVAQALVNPLIIFYDVHKAYREDGPLARWFAEQSPALREAEASGRLALLWHGLWLFDRVTGRMVGFTAKAAKADENFVALNLLWPSLTSRANLGDNNCSLAEMVQRGPGPNGYQCLGYTCATAFGSNSDPNLQTAASGFRLSRLQSVTDNDVFMQSLPGCSQSGADTRTQGSGNLCAGQSGVSAAAGRAAKEVRCVSKTIVQPGTEAMQCLSEVTGRCSNPVQQLTKELRQTTYAGVKLGKDCLIGAAKKDGKKPEKSEEEKKKEQEQKRQEEERRQKEEEARRQEAERRKKELEEQLKKAAELRQKADEEASKAAAAKLAQDKASKRMAEQKTANDEYLQAFNDFAKARDAETKALERATELLGELQDRLEVINDLMKQLTGGNRVSPACDPAEGCPTNDCTAMASTMDRAMECTGRKLEGGSKPVSQGPGTCDPTVCDNFEPGRKGSRGWEACIFQMDDAVKDAADRQCWMTRCADNETATFNNGRCTCGASLTGSGGRGGGLRNMCELAYCTGDAALSQGSFVAQGTKGDGSSMPGWLNGGCSCGVPNGITGAGPLTTPPKLVVLPPAPSFSDRNRGTLLPPVMNREPQPGAGGPRQPNPG